MGKYIGIVLLCLFSIALQAQNDFFKNPPIIISFYSHSIGTPFKDFVKTPLNFGLAIGTEFTYNQKEIQSLHQKVEIGWYHHKNLQKGFWVKTDLVRRYKAKKGLYGEAQVSLGYLQDFNAYETFELTEGRYQKVENASKGHFLGGFGLGAGYETTVNDKYLVAPFVRYESLLQFPYSKLTAVLPHTLFHVGTRFQLKQ